jgi:hypothetical protein
MVSNIRGALIDDDGREHSVPEPTLFTFTDPFGGDFTADAGDPSIFYSLDYFSLQNLPELPSDTVIFAKNLVRALTGQPARWASWVGWSGSARNPPLITSGVRGGTPQGPASFKGPMLGGGNFNRWHQPDSGLRYDGFLIYAGASDSSLFQDQSFDIRVDPDHPMTAPLAWVVGDNDVVLPEHHAFIYANQVARAFAAQGQGERINDFLRIYSPAELTHLVRDQLITSYDGTRSDDALWFDYQPGVFPNPSAFNLTGRGLRVSQGMARALPWNGPTTDWEDFFYGESRMARITPLMLALLADLREAAESGAPLPTSRIDPRLFTDPSKLDGAVVPAYPIVECPSNDTFQDLLSCAAGLTTDSGRKTDFQPYAFAPHEIDELRWFAQNNPLARSLEPLLVPDIAAPLGTKLFTNTVIEAPFTDAQLRARYGTHGGYVDAFAAATARLVEQRLWEERLGADYVMQAARSPVLRRP